MKRFSKRNVFFSLIAIKRSELAKLECLIIQMTEEMLTSIGKIDDTFKGCMIFSFDWPPVIKIYLYLYYSFERLF
jgi:hypothetical protein